MGVTAPASLADLTRLGAGDLLHYLEREHPPESALEWLGIAVGQLPELTARARTADEVHGWSRTQRVSVRAPLLEALMRALGTSAAVVDQARRALTERYPDSPEGDGGPEDYADLLATAHRSSPRRAEMMIGGHTSFLAGAIEAAGSLTEAELAIARARRWERVDPARTVEVRSAQLYAALSNVLGGLLAYAQLITEDAARLSD
jgi:hypothetical protein